MKYPNAAIPTNAETGAETATNPLTPSPSMAPPAVRPVRIPPPVADPAPAVAAPATDMLKVATAPPSAAAGLHAADLNFW